MNNTNFIKTILCKPDELESDIKNITKFISPSISVKLNTATKSGTSFHVGAFFYCDNQWDITNPSGYEIKNNSLDKTRKSLVKKLLEWIHIKDKTGSSHLTLHTKLNYLKYFINWADINRHSKFHQSIKSTRDAYRDYCRHLEKQIRIEAISVNTGAARIREMDDILTFVWDIDIKEIRAGIRIPRYSQKLKNNTIPPTKKHLEIVLTLYKELFLELSNFILMNKKYPHKIYIMKEELYIFPSSRMTVSSKLKDKRYKMWDYETGEYSAESKIKSKLKKANIDFRHPKRRSLANTACQCFHMLFIANTAMNPYTASGLKWSDKYKVENNKQGFKAIKYRAGNKSVGFNIESKFMPLFKIYLELRSYIVNNRDFDNLFVLLTSKGEEKLISYDPKNYKSLNKKIINVLDPEFPKINPREYRVHKANVLINKTDISTTAMLLQNTEATVAMAYTEGRQEDAEKEMLDFFSKTSKAIIDINTKTQSIPSGQCTQIEMPANKSDTDPIKSDCSNPFSCLFCDKYGIHADETDLRKLLSIRYIAKESRFLAHSDKHYEKIFAKLIQKINAIIDEIKKSEKIIKEVIQKVMDDVDKNENLSFFWQNKLNTLAKLGVL